MSKRFWLLIASLICSVAHADTLQTVVSQHYPAWLTEAAAEDGYRDARQQAYTSLSVNGNQYVVAVYSNGEVGAIVLLRQAAGGYVLSDDHADGMAGKNPEVRARDVDGDGAPEVVGRLETARGGGETWIYHITADKLVNMTPMNHGLSLLAVPELLDLSGTGMIELAEISATGPRSNPAITYNHFVLQNGQYVAAEPLDFMQVFYREKGAPHFDTTPIDIPADSLGKPYRLVVVNGGSLGHSYRVTAGEVRVNGNLVSGPSDFGQNRASWSVPVSLQQHNVLTVRLEGKPSSRIAIVVRHD